LISYLPSSILDPRSSILDPRSSILDPRSSILDPQSSSCIFVRLRGRSESGGGFCVKIEHLLSPFARKAYTLLPLFSRTISGQAKRKLSVVFIEVFNLFIVLLPRLVGTIVASEISPTLRCRQSLISFPQERIKGLLARKSSDTKAYRQEVQWRDEMMSNLRFKILVVEDDQNMRLTLTELLRLEGYSVVTARDGDEGYLQAMAHQPDLVVTDLNMPILDGMELARLLRRQRGKIAGVPIIGLSANLVDYNLDENKRTGIDSFIDKAAGDRQRLMTEIRSLLGVPATAAV
jgi:CheY-like chemotaxis protein